MMELEFRTSSCECYITKSGKRVSVIEDSCRGGKQYYHVIVRQPEMIGETIATRCTYQQAMLIAKEQYFAD